MPIKDNRNLHDSNLNQKLSREEIHNLKDEGLTGEVSNFQFSKLILTFYFSGNYRKIDRA